MPGPEDQFTRFAAPMAGVLKEFGRDPWHVDIGEPLRINLGVDRSTPEHFPQNGVIDTIAVLGSSRIPAGEEVWIRFREKGPWWPLHEIGAFPSLITKEFWLMHDPIQSGGQDVEIWLALGRDMRVMSVSPRDQGTTNIGDSVDVSDRGARNLGQVTFPSAQDVNVSDRAARELGQVTFPSPQEMTLTGSYSYSTLARDTALEVTNKIAVIRVTGVSTTATIHFEGSRDGATWEAIWVKSIYGGHAKQYLFKPDVVFVDASEYDQIRYTYDVDANSDFAVNVAFRADAPEVISVVMPAKQYAPKPAYIEFEAKDAGGRILGDVTADGTLYASANANIYKTTNEGDNWSGITHPFTGGALRRIKKLDTGELLLIGNNLDGAGGCQVWKSDADEANITKITTLQTKSDSAYDWGIDIHGSLIVYAPYAAQTRLSTEPLGVYISYDYGDNWTQIHEAPETESWHYHGVRLDPYDNRIWVTYGDTVSLRGVMYSDDWGSTWTDIWGDGEAPLQFVDVGVMPHCLLFGLDITQGEGIMRMDRPRYRATPGELKNLFHEAYIWRPGATSDTGNFAMSRYDEPALYVPMTGRQGIIGTKDGYNFYTIWAKMRGISGSSPLEIRFLGRPTSEGRMYAAWRNANTDYLLIGDEPEWVEI